MPVSSPGLPFGLKDGKLYCVEEVPRGLACGCICPACGAPLVARKGGRQAHHFAHYRGHSCAHALETCLHLRVKEVLSGVRRLAVPAVYLHRQEQPVFLPELLRFERVKQEKGFGGLVPDLWLESGPKRLLVEVAFSHAAGERKRNRLQQLGVSALELDVAGAYRQALLPDGRFDAATFEHELVHGLEHKQWLYHHKQQLLEYKLRRQAALRPVKHRYYKGYHSYLVLDCPIGKRRWQSGFRRGAAYALLWQDCLYCSRCLEIEYEKEFVGFRKVPQQPKAVLCWGHLPAPRRLPWVSSL